MEQVQQSHIILVFCTTQTDHPQWWCTSWHQVVETVVSGFQQSCGSCIKVHSQNRTLYTKDHGNEIWNCKVILYSPCTLCTMQSFTVHKSSSQQHYKKELGKGKESCSPPKIEWNYLTYTQLESAFKEHVKWKLNKEWWQWSKPAKRGLAARRQHFSVCCITAKYRYRINIENGIHIIKSLNSCQN